MKMKPFLIAVGIPALAFVLAFIVQIFISACDRRGAEIAATEARIDITSEFKLPPELSGYRVLQLQRRGCATLYVLIGSNESRRVIGAVASGKFPAHVIAVNGEEDRCSPQT